jgi:very-short-patch-repair endonuclease
MRRVGGYKFLRQYSVGPYILDFYCASLKLGIEVDGRFHGDAEVAAYDQQRSDFLASHGINLIRFWNDEVIQDVSSVMIRLQRKIVEIENSPLEEGELEGL